MWPDRKQLEINLDTIRMTLLEAKLKLESRVRFPISGEFPDLFLRPSRPTTRHLEFEYTLTNRSRRRKGPKARTSG